MPWTLILRYALVGGALLWLGLTVKGWHDDAQALPLERAAHEQTRSDFDTYRTRIERDLKIATEASNGYQTALRALEDDIAARPLPPVRVCRNRPAAVLPAPSGAPGGSDAAGPPRDAGADETDRDIGPELDAFARDSEANLRQLEALQGWIRATR